MTHKEVVMLQSGLAIMISSYSINQQNIPQPAGLLTAFHVNEKQTTVYTTRNKAALTLHSITMTT